MKVGEGAMVKVEEDLRKVRPDEEEEEDMNR